MEQGRKEDEEEEGELRGGRKEEGMRTEGGR